MTPRATTSLSLHYHVKTGQREAVLAEIKGTLDLCAKEPEFITAIITKLLTGQMSSYSTSYGKERARSSTLYRGRSLTAKPIWRV
jgi:hypothetical protein